VLDDDGIAKEANKLFDELMGPLWKFANFEFAQSASDDKGKSALAAAIESLPFLQPRQCQPVAVLVAW
jgi:hypothetical protein